MNTTRSLLTILVLTACDVPTRDSNPHVETLDSWGDEADLTPDLTPEPTPELTPELTLEEPSEATWIPEPTLEEPELTEAQQWANPHVGDEFAWNVAGCDDTQSLIMEFYAEKWELVTYERGTEERDEMHIRSGHDYWTHFFGDLPESCVDSLWQERADMNCASRGFWVKAAELLEEGVLPSTAMWRANDWKNNHEGPLPGCWR